MCYRCDICESVVERGKPRRTHYILRENGSVERELPICTPCAEMLETGVPLAIVQRQRGKPLTLIPLEPEPPPEPGPVPTPIFFVPSAPARKRALPAKPGLDTIRKKQPAVDGLAKPPVQKTIKPRKPKA